jgi:hypothetical protein
MIFKSNSQSFWKRCAAMALAFLLLVLTPTLAFADYSINGYTVKGTGGDNIKIVGSNGKVLYEGKGERNSQGRLAPPQTSSYRKVIQAPNVEQGYAKSNSSQYNRLQRRSGNLQEW